MKRSLSRARIKGLTLLVGAVALAIILMSCARQPRRLAPANEVSSAPGTPVQRTTSSRLNINAASTAELQKLPGVGEVLATRIVAYRQQYGPFRRVEHLMMVPGFSDYKFRALRELITVE
jgi:competence protein ComEA